MRYRIELTHQHGGEHAELMFAESEYEAAVEEYNGWCDKPHVLAVLVDTADDSTLGDGEPIEEDEL